MYFIFPSQTTRYRNIFLPRAAQLFPLSLPSTSFGKQRRRKYLCHSTERGRKGANWISGQASKQEQTSELLFIFSLPYLTRIFVMCVLYSLCLLFSVCVCYCRKEHVRVFYQQRTVHWRSISVDLIPLSLLSSFLYSRVVYLYRFVIRHWCEMVRTISTMTWSHSGLAQRRARDTDVG